MRIYQMAGGIVDQFYQLNHAKWEKWSQIFWWIDFNADLCMLFQFQGYFNEKEKIEEENNYLGGRELLHK